MRASGRSTLFTTSTIGSRASSALRSTKRVCGSGPSLASTSSRAPSTIVSARSTSPPKSAWPGVSTMLTFTPPMRTDAFLARIVMPRSRSWSIESMTRSVSSSWAEKIPDWRSIASTSVVLPWSTCAMIATLRMSSRAAMRGSRVEGASAAAARSVARRALALELRHHRLAVQGAHQVLQRLGAALDHVGGGLGVHLPGEAVHQHVDLLLDELVERALVAQRVVDGEADALVDAAGAEARDRLDDPHVVQ